MVLFGTEIMIQLGEIFREHDENEELTWGGAKFLHFKQAIGEVHAAGPWTTL